MPKTRDQKVQAVADLTDRLSKANSVVFADYKGLTMSQLSDIRNQLLDMSAELSVTKNNLLKLALEKVSKEGKVPNVPKASDTSDTFSAFLFQGPTATLFAYEDEISPIKVLTKALKDNQMGSVKAGILNGEYLDAYSINKLAQLPSKDELRAKIVGSLGSPLYGIVGVLQANLRNLVYALDQIRVSKGGDAI